MANGRGAVDGPVLVSQRRGLSPVLVALTGLCAVFALLAMGTVAYLETKSGQARVLGPVPGTGQTRVEVLDGPDPKAWRVPTEEVDGAAPGDVIEVRLGGDCDCEPYPATGDPVAVLAACGVMLLLFALVLRSYVRSRPAVAAQARARRLLVPDAPVAPVRLEPSIRAKGRRVRAVARVVTPDHRVLGELDLGTVHAAFDPTLRWWLVGEPAVGSPVALVSEGRRQVLLPSSPLVPPSEEPAWSPTAVSMIGWAPSSAGAGDVPALPSEGRVALGTGGRDDEEQLQRRLAVQQRVGRKVGFALIGVMVVAFGLVLVGFSFIVVFPFALACTLGLGMVGGRLAVGAASRELELDPAVEQHALEIGTSVSTWQTLPRQAPAYRSALPVAAV